MIIKRALKILLATTIAVSLAGADLYAKRVTTRHKAPKPKAGAVYPVKRHHKGKPIDFGAVSAKLQFMAYDKKGSSDKETFFVDNGSDIPLSSIEVEITYQLENGKVIHRRKVKINQEFPAKETRRVDITSWDKQKSFHYINSYPSKNGSTPYVVRFHVLSVEPMR